MGKSYRNGLILHKSDFKSTPKKLIKTIFLLSICGFVLTNISFLIGERSLSDDSTEEYMQMSNESREEDRMRFLADREKRRNIVNHLKFANSHREIAISNNSSSPRGANGTVNSSHWIFPDHPHKIDPQLLEIKSTIWESNKQQEILNLEKFDLSPSDTSVVIVVQVHNRTEYLKHLIESLGTARDIDKTLVIFSHDHFSSELNDIVRSITFCPVMQIFYPYSQQLYQHEFPGEDPRDCPRNITKMNAMKTNCVNKNYPDKYGHYREAKYTQTKHHWFWKLNHVFDHLDVTKLFEGLFLFIEEDHYLAKDFVPVLLMMHRLRQRSCQDCSVLTLGNYDKKPKFGEYANKVNIMNWMSSKHNMGMGLTRGVWSEIKKCGVAFCRMDDYNWDWSLHFVALTCIPKRLKVMVMKSPRIFHIGECGLHAKGKNCNPSDRVSYIRSLLKTHENDLHPRSLVISDYPSTPKRVQKPNGGWGDHRDHQLCASFMDLESHR